jgi:hypothetical protein
MYIKVGKDHHSNENVSKMLLKKLKKWLSEKVPLYKGRLVPDNGTAINNLERLTKKLCCPQKAIL